MLNYPYGLSPYTVALSTSDPLHIAGAAVALANTNGGNLIIRLPEPTQVPETVLSAARDYCRPAVHMSAHQQLHANTYQVYIHESPQLHALADGRVLVRHFDNNRRLNGDEIRQLAHYKNLGRFERTPVPGTQATDFDPNLLRPFVARLQLQVPELVPVDTEHLLHVIHALDSCGQPTVTGLLAFSEHPQHWLPQAGIRFKHFVGKVGGHHQLVQQQELRGPVTHLIDRAMALIRTATSSSLPSSNGNTRSRYPAPALHEALLNAIVHRDYRLHQLIEIAVYDDCVLIESPGNPAGFLTSQKVVEGHFHRNPALTNILRWWGYMQGHGDGIQRMKTIFKQAQAAAPDFAIRKNRFHLSLWPAPAEIPFTPGASSAHSAGPKLEGEQARILEKIRQSGSLSLRESRVHFPDIGLSDLGNCLNQLVQKKILRKIELKGQEIYFLRQAKAE
jgi:ATP-dependent DNA helicase RecG